MDNHSCLQRQDVQDKVVLNQFLLDCLEYDSYCRVLKSDWIAEWAAAGFLEMFSKTYIGVAPTITNPVAWFITRVSLDLQDASRMDKQQMKDLLTNLNMIDVGCLNKCCQLSVKYKLITPESRKDFKSILTAISSKEDKLVYILSYFSDTLLHAEVRILEHVFEAWFAEKFVLKEEGKK